MTQEARSEWSRQCLFSSRLTPARSAMRNGKSYIWRSSAQVASPSSTTKIAKRECGNLRLILMDLGLPAKGGIAATTLIREIMQLCHVPIVARTAHSELEHRNAALAAGGCDSIAKPVNFEKLANVIKPWLPQNERAD